MFSDKPVRRKTLFNVRVTQDEAKRIDASAKALGISRSQLLRLALDHWYQHAPEARKAAR